MPIDLYSSTLKPFIIPLGFTVTATICLLMTLKKCMRGYVLCRQLSCQNFSFYFVLNLDTEPFSILYNYLQKIQPIPYFFYGSVRFYLFLCLLNIFHCPTIFSCIPNNAQLHFYSRASYLLRQILLYAGYFICSSCFLIILRTISPPIEPASLDVKSPL